jgi:hypothetical protein
VQEVLTNLQGAITKTYEKGWQAYGMGFIVIDNDGVKTFSIEKGYRGLKIEDQINDNLPEGLHLALANNPKAVFAVLQNMPDNGEEDYKQYIGWKFPIESENWYVITMGAWGNGDFTDQDLPWYNKTRPSLSLTQYLETNPEEINFDWIDQDRTPYIVAVKKDGSVVHVVDKYSGKFKPDLNYVKEEKDGMIVYHGVRCSDGKQA